MDRLKRLFEENPLMPLILAVNFSLSLAVVLYEAFRVNRLIDIDMQLVLIYLVYVWLFGWLLGLGGCMLMVGTFNIYDGIGACVRRIRESREKRRRTE